MRAAMAYAAREVKPYRPFNWRRRLVIAALALATAVFVVWMLLDPPGGVQRPRALGAPLPETPPPVRACAPGQTQGCIGGTTRVLTPAPALPRTPAAPVAPAASAGR
jgi:hypothetical protein